MLNRYQIGCLKEFLAALALHGGTPRSLKLITHMADPSPRDLREQGVLTAQQQKSELEATLQAQPMLDGKIEFHHRRYSPLHMRYAHFTMDQTNSACTVSSAAWT